MEFRKNAAECQGAVIRVSGSSGHENTPLSGSANSSQAAQPNQTVHRKAPRPAQAALASTPSKLSTDSTLAPALAPPQSSVVVPEEVTAPSSLKTAEVPASVSSGVAASPIVQKASDASTPLSLKPAVPSPGSPLTLLEAPAQLAGVIAIPEKVESPGPVQPTLRSIPSSPSAATTIEPAAEEASTTSR